MNDKADYFEILFTCDCGYIIMLESTRNVLSEYIEFLITTRDITTFKHLYKHNLIWAKLLSFLNRVKYSRNVCNPINY